jgi:DNA-directed RNA polymerase subunit N (RpoN/RPB10)
VYKNKQFVYLYFFNRQRGLRVMREGWIKSHRKVTESDIWNMPPLYFKVWNYLLYAACFEDKSIPMRDASTVKLNKGQHLTSIRTIAGKVGWYERGIEKTPNPKTITDILEWLTKQEMIQIANGSNDKQYTLITITNWDRYQADCGGESNSTDMLGQQPLDIKNKYNNRNNVKEMNKQREENKEREEKEDQEDKEGKEHNQHIDCTEAFNEFWNHYPRKMNMGKAYESFTLRISEGTKAEDLINAAKGYNRYCSVNKIGERYIKYANNFLAGGVGEGSSGSGSGSVSVSRSNGDDNNGNNNINIGKVYEEFINYVPIINSCNQHSDNVARALLLHDNPALESGSLW